MLSGTEVFIAALFVIALTLMSTIDVAFASVNKVAVRRLVDRPRGKAASSLATLLDTRGEVLTSIHIRNCAVGERHGSIRTGSMASRALRTTCAATC